MVIPASFRRPLWVAALAISAASTALAESHGKEILIALSWGDQIADVGTSGEVPLLTPESFRTVFRAYKKAGVGTVLFREEVFRLARDGDWPDPKTLPGFRNAPPWTYDAMEKQWIGTHQAVKINLLKSIVEIAHEEGLRIFAWSVTFNEGMPLNEVWHPKGDTADTDPKTGKPWHYKLDQTSDWVSNLIKAHPEYLMVDRSQTKHNGGTLEFAYPEARDYAVRYNRWFLENYAFDGLYVDFRDEYAHPDFGDQFGFAPPIVAEYQKRYGVNILRQEFDLESWRRLCGEYLTQFVRELHAMTEARGKPLLVGIPQGNHMGPPISNMYVDWQGWAKGHLVEGLMIGAYSGTFLFPEHIGYGYLSDMEFGFGLPNLLEDLQNNYWPECASNQVKVYVQPPGSGNHIALADLAKTSVDGFRLHFDALQKWERISNH